MFRLGNGAFCYIPIRTFRSTAAEEKTKEKLCKYLLFDALSLLG